MIESWKAAWRSIKFIYDAGLICSERHLQAELFHILSNDNNFKDKYRLHVEPSIFSDSDEISNIGSKGIIPDMLISDIDKIVAHVEIKYVPHGYIQFEKDIINLSKFYSIRGRKHPIYLLTDPVTGNWNHSKKYTVDSRARYLTLCVMCFTVYLKVCASYTPHTQGWAQAFGQLRPI